MEAVAPVREKSLSLGIGEKIGFNAANLSNSH